MTVVSTPLLDGVQALFYRPACMGKNRFVGPTSDMLSQHLQGWSLEICICKVPSKGFLLMLLVIQSVLGSGSPSLGTQITVSFQDRGIGQGTQSEQTPSQSAAQEDMPSAD